MRAILSDGDDVTSGASPGARKGRLGSSNHLTILAIMIVGMAVLTFGVLSLYRETTPPPSTDELRTRLAAVTSGYKCSSLDYSIGPDHSAWVSGFMASRENIDALRKTIGSIDGISKLTFEIDVRIWPYCEAVALLEGMMTLPKEIKIPASFALLPVSGEAHLGEDLIVDIQGPSFDGFMYVDYFDAEGDVLHLFPNNRDNINFEPARAHLVLGKPPLKRCWVLGGSTGEQLVTLVATTRPLFPDKRPEVDNARDYLPILSDGIKKVPEGSGVATFSFFQLHEALPFGAPRNGCREIN
jgi:hypothetical protein